MIWSFGSILYKHSIVGEVVNHTGVIYGARIHRTVALRMRTQTQTITKKEPVITDSFINIVICKQVAK